MKERILTDDDDRVIYKHRDFNEEGRLDEDINEISQFNKEFKTALIRPIVYDFDEDLTIKHRINYDESCFGMGLDKYFNLANFKTTIRDYGINYFYSGRSSHVNKKTAIEVFRKMDPDNKNKGEDDLMKYLQK